MKRELLRVTSRLHVYLLPGGCRGPSIMEPGRFAMSSYETLQYEVDEPNRYATIQLDRPDQLNALSVQLIDEFVDAVGTAESDDAVRAILLTGHEKAFSAGYDLSPSDGSDPADADIIPSVDELLDEFEENTEHVYAIWESNKPVLAAVQGYCLAGGSDMAMACDVVLAAENAVFGYPGLRMGGVPPTLIYPFVMNLHEAKELLLSGKMVEADHAAQLGMVNRVVPSERLHDEVEEEISEILKMPGNNVRILKHILNGIAEGQGARPILKYSEMFDALAHQTEYGREYFQIVAEEGMEAGLKFMNELDKGMVPSAGEHPTNA